MKDFKLIAVRPRSGCHRDFLKNLAGDQLYQFYNSYIFLNSEGKRIERTEGEVACYLHKSKVPDNLYEIKSTDKIRSNGMNFNLAAIAGKNGSGKSSLIELFFAAIFVMSARKEILLPIDWKIGARIQNIKAAIRESKLYLLDVEDRRNIFALSFNNAIKDGIEPPATFEEAEAEIAKWKKREDSLNKRLQQSIRELEEEKKKRKEIAEMTSRIYADVFYEIDGRPYQLTINPNYSEGMFLIHIPTEREYLVQPTNYPLTVEMDYHTLAKHFYYTIAINYSHYSLNSNHLGDWIRFLFHKNDGYRTPLVISPMRKAGNFDINDEMSFARTRLLINVLLPHLYGKNERDYQLTENQRVTEIVFTLNKSKTNRFKGPIDLNSEELDRDSEEYQLVQQYLHVALPKYADLDFKNFALRNILLNYIAYKIDKISANYNEFHQGFSWPVSDDDEVQHNLQFFQKLYYDKSHVTFKLHQATNFLRYCIEAKTSDEFYIRPDDLKGNKKISVSFKPFDLFKWTGTPSDGDLIRYLPPSLFEVDFRMSNSRNHSYRFSALSSGEQQFIHTIQSVIYHLNNIQSAHNNPERIRYEAVNIILDEIELYFHPDFQRQFIDRLLKQIAQINVDPESRIKTVNLLFLTHSPFMLSDIPSENVLRLEFKKSKGKTYPVVDQNNKNRGETFAANIHQLLSNSFFISGTSMGQFAEEKINALIEKINSGQQPDDNDRKLIALVGDRFLQASLDEFIERQK